MQQLNKRQDKGNYLPKTHKNLAPTSQRRGAITRLHCSLACPANSLQGLSLLPMGHVKANIRQQIGGGPRLSHRAERLILPRPWPLDFQRCSHLDHWIFNRKFFSKIISCVTCHNGTSNFKKIFKINRKV